MNLKTSYFYTLVAFLAALCLQSCSLVYDESDCVDSYNIVRFVYDYNMRRECELDKEVDQLSLLIFNKGDGTLAKRVDALQTDLNEANELSFRVEPGDYDLLVWAGSKSKPAAGGKADRRFEEDYEIAKGIEGATTIDEFYCYLKRENGQIDARINDLFNGTLNSAALPFASTTVPNRIEVDLKKDTNTFRIVLQQMSGATVNHEDYEVTITDDNGLIGIDNVRMEDETITYHPWDEMTGDIDINSNPIDAPGNAFLPSPSPTRAAAGSALWQLTTSRLDTDSNARLQIRRKSTGKTVIDISPIEYALLVKEFYNGDMTDQEYLDRQDEYDMTFYLSDDPSGPDDPSGDGATWLSTVVIINNWRIIRNNVTLE